MRRDSIYSHSESESSGLGSSVLKEGGDDGRLEEMEKLSSLGREGEEGFVQPLDDCNSQLLMGFACEIQRVNVKYFNFSRA